MELKFYIFSLLILCGLGRILAQEDASKEIKREVSEKFNNWVKKGEFEKNEDYQTRIRYANDTLQRFTELVINIKKQNLLEGNNAYCSLSPVTYNSEDETWLLKYSNSFGLSDSIVVKIAPNIAKKISQNINDLILYATDIQIINGHWKITNGYLLYGSYNWSICTFTKHDNDLFVIKNNRESSGKSTYLKTSASLVGSNPYLAMTNPYLGVGTLATGALVDIFHGSGSSKKKLHNLTQEKDIKDKTLCYLFWNITDQPTFNTATINPVTLNLEDLNISLPTNNNTSVNNRPKELDLDITKILSQNKNPDAIAIVIGNRDYNETKHVNYAIEDAQTIKNYLIKVLGYNESNILYYENATKSKFETLFGTKDEPQGKLANIIKSGVSDVFIYYSGHGAPSVKNNKGYFVPVDCDPQYVEQGGYSLDLFYANIAKLNAKSLTVVTDACFSGAELLKDISPITITISNPVAVASNCVVLSSSAGSQVSTWYNEKKHGLFTYFFLRAMQDKEKCDANKDNKLTFKEIFDYISDKTSGVPAFARSLSNVEQTPTIQGAGAENVLIEYK